MIQDVFRAEVQRPADPNSAARRPPTSVEWESNRQLNAAVIDGHLDQLRILLVEKGLDPNARDEHGNTVGHQAAADDQDDALRMLLFHGLNVDAVNDDGDTPLHMASRNGMVKATRALADGFPDEYTKNHRGFTALDEAISAGTTRCNSCIRDFSSRGKFEAMKGHVKVERNRLAKLRKNKEILYGRDVDTLPREADFRPNRLVSITAADKAHVNAWLQATVVTQRCVAAGLQSAVTILEGRQAGA